LPVAQALSYACSRLARRTDPHVRLRKPLERSIRSGHPWIYRDALLPFQAEAGSVVVVESKDGQFLARGLAEAGPIGVRVFTTRDEPVAAPLFMQRVARAFDLRARIIAPDTTAYRLLHGEGDRLPGVVCDRYGPFAVLKLDGDAAWAWNERLSEWLQQPLRELGVRGLLLRTTRKNAKPIRLAWGETPEPELVVDEHGMRLAANLWQGQKTGLFLDHRESRLRVRQLARGLRVLNLYGYTGGFSVAAGLGEASFVITVDSAPKALELAERSWQHNHLPPATHAIRAADVHALLPLLLEAGERFGLVVADPPSFAPNAPAKPAALASYAALHEAALRLVERGGLYLAASCSSHLTRDDFDATLREGSRRAKRPLQVLERWSAPADHPRLLAFPEGDYLKVTLLRAD
jgi:23S rRNA (cytosine1962-C5)-methyltransferase